MRLDLFIGHTTGFSRARLRRLFEEGAVQLGGRTARKGDRVQAGQTVQVWVSPEQPTVAPNPTLPLVILHTDEALVFADKPAGMPSHPLKAQETGTLANALIARYPECAAASKDPREGGLCHRLDIDTSGVLVGARTREAWTQLRAQFSRAEVDKRYLALVAGPVADSGEVDLPLHHRATRVVPRPDGRAARAAKSLFRVLARGGEYSLLEVQLVTGVLHQARAHLAAIGAPVLGDTLYGGRSEPDLPHFLLHAQSLEVTHPLSGRRLKVKSPLPREFQLALEKRGIPPPSS
jgi:23S rRNA pseudouridine1911/1915/1917 synthase